ncbi:MAG: hypothetical protein PHQ98_02125 [Candidatus ainarchaeum sp.]|nr:hypothetical protein [Candidatus ainarchaeum sp.]
MGKINIEDELMSKIPNSTETKRVNSKFDIEKYTNQKKPNNSDFIKPKIPYSVVKRYEEQFGKKKLKKAIKFFIISFIFIFLILNLRFGLMQEIDNNNQIKITNMTTEKITNLSIIRLSDLNQVFYKDILNKKESIIFDQNKGLYLVFSNKFIPIIISK